MPEPKFKVGWVVILGVDTFGSVPSEMEGKTVRIFRADPFDDVHDGYFYHVQVVDSDMTARVHETYIEMIVA